MKKTEKTTVIEISTLMLQLLQPNFALFRPLHRVSVDACTRKLVFSRRFTMQTIPKIKSVKAATGPTPATRLSFFRIFSTHTETSNHNNGFPSRRFLFDFFTLHWGQLILYPAILVVMFYLGIVSQPLLQAADQIIGDKDSFDLGLSDEAAEGDIVHCAISNPGFFLFSGRNLVLQVVNEILHRGTHHLELRTVQSGAAFHRYVRVSICQLELVYLMSLITCSLLQRLSSCHSVHRLSLTRARLVESDLFLMALLDAQQLHHLW